MALTASRIWKKMIFAKETYEKNPPENRGIKKEKLFIL